MLKKIHCSLAAMVFAATAPLYCSAEESQAQIPVPSTEKIIYVMPPTFERNSQSAHALNECQLEAPVKESLAKELQREGYEVKFLSSQDTTDFDGRALSIGFEKIEPHVMSGVTFRPGSRATFVATGYSNGEPGLRYSRPISTRVRLGACERLYDIVEASIEHAVPWYIRTKSKNAPTVADILAEEKISTKYKFDRVSSEFETKYDLAVNYEAIAVDIVNASDQEVLNIIKFVDRHNFYYPIVYLAIDSRVMSYSPFSDIDSHTTKVIKHLLKRLANSRNVDAFETLEKVSLEADNDKIKKYAAKLLKRYGS